MTEFGMKWKLLNITAQAISFFLKKIISELCVKKELVVVQAVVLFLALKSVTFFI